MKRRPRIFENKPYGLYTTMDFGKHKKRQIRDVIQEDPDYLLWCLDNIDGFKLTQDAEDALEDAE